MDHVSPTTLEMTKPGRQPQGGDTTQKVRIPAGPEFEPWVAILERRMQEPVGGQLVAALDSKLPSHLTPAQTRRLGSALGRGEDVATQFLSELANNLSQQSQPSALAAFVRGIGEVWSRGVRRVFGGLLTSGSVGKGVGDSLLQGAQLLRVSELAPERRDAREILTLLAEAGRDDALRLLLDEARKGGDLDPAGWSALIAGVTPHALRRMQEQRCSQQRLVDAAGFVIDTLWRLDQPEQIDNLLAELRPWSLPSAVTVAILAGTKKGAARLRSRQAFLTRARDTLTAREPDEAEVVLRMVG